MSDLVQLHYFARLLYDHVLASVNPRTAVRDAVRQVGSDLVVCNRPLKAPNGIYVVALGKAATRMALGLQDALGEAINGGVLSGPSGSKQQFVGTGWQIFEGGHPLPNEASLGAGQAALELLDLANSEGTAIVFLVSGGGSAMIEWPRDTLITLSDLRRANQLLTSCGAKIGEINAVRRQFSALKGGRLARRASRATMVTLIVSDTNPGDEASVASGPTLFPSTESPDPMTVVSAHQLEPLLPGSIMSKLRRARTVPERSEVSPPHFVLLDNQTALSAAARMAVSQGFSARIQSEISEQMIEDGCRLLLDANSDEPTCLISGGEFSCPVRGNGRGGRNLETVLRCAIELDRNKPERHCVVLSAGTDGIDGNSPAAGAIADETTIQRARALGLSAEDFLSRSDSYAFFEKLGDLIVTGPTGTNVRDLRLILRHHGVR